MLSSISSITTSIDIKDQFSFVDTLGSLVGNRDFGLSYQKYRDGEESGTGGNVDTYLWESLESIGNNIGRKIHSNIKEYINLVSDVDTCKVKSLQSMFNVYGEHYDLIDNVERYPLELRNLIDIFSIDKKYLLKNDYINDDFRRDLEEEEVIVSSNHPDIPELYDVQFKDDQYARYMGSIFKTLLSDFLNLSYNDTNETVIKDTLTRDELDGLMLSASDSYEDSISQFKLANNIPMSFNESKIVDDIDNGDDFLENYSGVERQLLEMEISKRAATFQVLYNVTAQKTLNQHQQSVEQKTRYSYYRRAKVLEYYRFINNAFSTGSDIGNSTRYSFDNSYIEFGRKTDDTTNGNILIWNDKTSTYDINEPLLDDTVEILVNITQYIRTLRERLKRQTRKNYMKGTMNLLVYVINQYMVDYAKTQSSIFKNLAGTQLSGLREKLQIHSSENVKVIEYVDETEYSNIETDVDSKSLNGNSTNPRYWDGFYQTSNQFTEDELQKFYLNDLQLSSDSHISDAYQLLDIIFNLGASTSHIDKQTGEFTAKMSDIDDRYSLDVQNERDELETSWNGFVSQLSVLGDDYQYPEGTVSVQIDSLEHMVEDKLSSQLLSSVSVVYEKYIGDTIDISSNMVNLTRKYDTLTSETYGVYFDGYSDSSYGIYNKLHNVKEYAVVKKDQNIRFWDLSGTVVALSNSLTELSARFSTQIDELTVYNYVDICSEYLDESITDALNFTNAKLETNPADGTLKNIKTHLSEIKTQLNISTDVYQNLRTNEKYLQYFGDTAYNYNEYTFRQLGEMMGYINQTDSSNMVKIARDIENLIAEYSDINTTFGDLEEKAATELVNYVPTGLTLEEQIEHLKQMLLEDIQSNINNADDELNAIMTTLRGYSTVIKDEIASELSNVSRLSVAVDDRLYQLNPLNYDEYVNAKAQFDMYNGISADSDLYFNPKNTAHPSRQYHPYLRNFIMNDRLTNMIQNVINAYTVDELDEDRIQNNITKYIGEFGQQLNIWKNDAIDYTGYSSLYESSNNSSRKTGTIHEGQHYDGLFHPAAVRMMIELGKDRCIQSFLSALEGEYDEFFTKFYGPLGMTAKDINLEIGLLSSFYDNVVEVANPHSENEVFDIYRYGLDAFNNSYSLLKQYNTDNQTYQLKRNTPGRLWLKKYGYPFSYPAFLSSDLLSSFVGIDNNYAIFRNTILSELSGGPGKFYDFEFSNDREFVALVTENNTVSGYQSYDSANVFISKVQLSGSHPYIEDNDVFKHEKMEYCLNDRYAADFQAISCVTLTDVLMKTAYEVYSSPMSVVFDSSKIEENISEISSMTIRQILQTPDVSSVVTADSETRYLEGASSGEWYTLIGCLPNNSKFYTAYVKKHISYSESTDTISSNLLDSLPVALVDYENQKTAYASIQLPREHTGDNVIASMCDDNTIAFATLIHSPLSEEDGTLRTYTAEKGTLSSSNSNGDESSHDVYTSDIFVRKCAIREQSLEYISQASFNTNADTSYIPMYPGNNNVTELNTKPISSDSYFPLELLGKSRNIDDMIASVNPNADPYFTIDDIKENYLFGRVYEDYASDLDKTLKIVGNPRICTNPADSSVSRQGNDFEWKITLSNLFGDATERYNADDYKKLKILMYNQDNYGKNPYLFADLSSFTGSQPEITANYNSNLSNFEEELDINTDVIGTYDNKRINSLENNSIYNISCITLHFNGSSSVLDIKFSTISAEYVDNTYIDKDKIKVCLINDKDLSMFKYYHYMDAYGLYISADANENGTEISNWYYKDGSKITEGSVDQKEYLRNIDFSSKDHLSDMVILSGYERAIFKYDEEVKYGLDDDVTIMPTINLIYPKTAGSYLYERGSLMSQNTEEDTTNIFQENELFFVDIPNAQEILSSIGRIKIDLNVSDADMFILNEEAFLDNRPRYSTEDPMILSCASLVEVSAIPSNITVNSGPVGVEMDVFINNMSALIGSDNNTYSFLPLCTEEGSSLQSRIVDVSNYPIDISRFLKIHVNYKKESENNITLYFNYLNYLNTPYVKQIDGRTYIDIIDGTYLKLNSGENGRMDIVLQFRYFEGQHLVGLKNVRVLSYQIYNISDDKPKFIIKEIYRIQKDSDIMNASYSVFIEGSDTICDRQTTDFVNTIRWKSDTTLNKIVFDVIYDSSIIDFNGVGDRRFEVLGPSTFTVTVTDFTYNFIDIPFKFKDGVERYTSQVQLDDVKVYPTDVNHKLVLESVRDGNIIVE